MNVFQLTEVSSGSKWEMHEILVFTPGNSSVTDVLPRVIILFQHIPWLPKAKVVIQRQLKIQAWLIILIISFRQINWIPQCCSSSFIHSSLPLAIINPRLCVNSGSKKQKEQWWWDKWQAVRASHWLCPWDTTATAVATATVTIATASGTSLSTVGP